MSEHDVLTVHSVERRLICHAGKRSYRGIDSAQRNSSNTYAYQCVRAGPDHDAKVRKWDDRGAAEVDQSTGEYLGEWF